MQNNKPVAYITMSGLSYQQTGLNDRPLYTHPVKELTDEEIDTIVRDFFGEVSSFYDFRLVIRRCIRKAQEK